jgi:hypothetical protein
LDGDAYELVGMGFVVSRLSRHAQGRVKFDFVNGGVDLCWLAAEVGRFGGSEPAISTKDGYWRNEL